MALIEGIGSQEEQIGLESDSLESVDAALATGITRLSTDKGKATRVFHTWNSIEQDKAWIRGSRPCNHIFLSSRAFGDLPHLIFFNRAILEMCTKGFPVFQDFAFLAVFIV